jgi:hypothetical protein
MTYESKEVNPLTSLSISSLTLFESIAAVVCSNGRCKREILREKGKEIIFPSHSNLLIFLSP